MPLNKRLVRERTAKYGFLKSYLDTRGYTVYPSEIIIGMQDIPHTDGCWAVDVAAFKDDHYYAFEFKSSGDQLQRAILQVENYRCSFDYVIVVVEEPRGCFSTRMEKKILATGAGLWIVQFGKVEEDLVHRIYKSFSKPVWEERWEPKLQHPNLENKHYIEQKFKRYCFGYPVPEDPNQKTITSYLH